MDLAVGNEPQHRLIRVYRNQDTASRAFGIGTSHTFALWPRSEGAREWPSLELIDAAGSRTRFVRTDADKWPEQAEYRAMSQGNFAAAVMTFDPAAVAWEMKRRDGWVYVFSRRGKLVVLRDPQRRTIAVTLAQGDTGNVTRIEFERAWIALSYDARHRVVGASDSWGRSVVYDYDERGRLVSVRRSDGRTHLYSYNERDEMVTIHRPGHLHVVNDYDGTGRVTRQVSEWFNPPSRYAWDFAYSTNPAGRIVQVAVSRSDGLGRHLTFNDAGYSVREAYSQIGAGEIAFDYARDPRDQAVLGVTVRCTDPAGKPRADQAPVPRGESLDQIRALLAIGCTQGVSLGDVRTE